MSAVPRLPSPKPFTPRGAVRNPPLLKVEARDRPTAVVDFDALLVRLACDGDLASVERSRYSIRNVTAHHLDVSHSRARSL